MPEKSIDSKEADLGISEEASWRAKYEDSAHVFVGDVPYGLTEDDLLRVFAQYGEIVDINLVRDKGTGKSKGFAFLAYEDPRSALLAVDNLDGIQLSGQIIRVDHCSEYMKRVGEAHQTLYLAVLDVEEARDAEEKVRREFAAHMEKIKARKTQADEKLEASLKALGEIKTAIDLAQESTESAEAAKTVVELELVKFGRKYDDRTH
ncbi:PREDICTED: zinc finger CCCH domain-containing protein 25-like [Tarenaya hassleriana]|uniref:zinc finger CCCH domain-containing protein 25-like n=1 Tax=Tarenaya hassleriana TaxID=28532 RepID=UPI00053C8529|nr:PREDICTED: zinc finger CCCH domain-containing protein 25-like [Tarenaya hassleriana]